MNPIFTDALNLQELKALAKKLNITIPELVNLPDISVIESRSDIPEKIILAIRKTYKVVGGSRTIGEGDFFKSELKSSLERLNLFSNLQVVSTF
jgi:hypothetical protein